MRGKDGKYAYTKGAINQAEHLHANSKDMSPQRRQEMAKK
jgi:hypothetical protein